jgi:hypothetical protein
LIARVPEIKTIDLFNNQFERESKNNPVKFPCCFIEFENFDWKSQSGGIQIGNLVVKFHIGFETYKTNNSSGRPDESNDIDFLDLIEKIHTSINMFNTENFNPLLRVTEQQNTDHDNVLTWVVSYSTMITDDGAERRFADQLINMIPDTVGSIGLTINFPESETADVAMVGAWWWFTGSNPALAKIYFRFDLLDVAPETNVLVQYNNGNGWITSGSALRSTFVDGDGIHDQFLETSIAEIHSFDPPATRARVMLSGIGHSNEILVLPD